MRKAFASIRRRPFSTLLSVVAIALAAYVVGFPFTQSSFAPMTDLPFHAAQTSIFRHYFDPSFHLREQFELHPLAVPYVSSYVLGAIFMLVAPVFVAVKLAAFVMLSLLPIGLATMFHGMKKSPLLGLAGLPFVWVNLTHWGFLNFVGAIGLFAASIGVTLLVLDKPTRGRKLLLCGLLVLLFFTHIFRFPFAILGVLGTALVMYPATKRFSPILAPLLPPILLFLVWLWVRPAAIGGAIDLSHIDWQRKSQLVPLLMEGGFYEPTEEKSILTSYRVLGAVALFSLLAYVAEARWSGQTRRVLAWGFGVTLVGLGCAGAFLLLFFMLPMQSGIWWYIYPREAVAAAFIALSVLPDLPKTFLLRSPLVLALALGPIGLTRSLGASYRAFDKTTEDFRAILPSIPRAPKLMYLVFDHSGSTKKNTPFIHLPAYVQAVKGGWLSFHFAGFGASPVAYRPKTEPGAVVPPPFPLRWEWTPQAFRVNEHGRFYDWFLVRSRTSPAWAFQADSSIVPVDHQGTWWLYRRSEKSR